MLIFDEIFSNLFRWFKNIITILYFKKIALMELSMEISILIYKYVSKIKRRFSRDLSGLWWFFLRCPKETVKILKDSEGFWGKTKIDKKKKNRDMLLRTRPKTQSDRDFLDGISASDIRQYANMWGLPKDNNVPVYIYVKAGGYNVTQEAFFKQNLEFETLIDDWQQ